MKRARFIITRIPHGFSGAGRLGIALVTPRRFLNLLSLS